MTHAARIYFRFAGIPVVGPLLGIAAVIRDAIVPYDLAQPNQRACTAELINADGEKIAETITWEDGRRETIIYNNKEYRDAFDRKDFKLDERGLL